MPNENRNPKGLDTLCLLSESPPIESVFQSEFYRAMETIRKNQLVKNNLLNQYFENLESESLDSHTIKKLVQFQRANAPSKTMRICNTTPIESINPDIEIPLTMKISEYGYGMSGLNRCKNPFCPMCSKSRAGERAHRLKQGIMGAQLRGYGVYFVTLTIPRSGSIKSQRDELRRRWKRCNNLFQLWRTQGAETYTARALDVTFNPYRKDYRYHMHIHAIVIVSQAVERVEERIKDTWIASNTKDCKALYKCQDVQKVGATSTDTNRVGRYVAKMAGLAREITHGQKKDAKATQSITLTEMMLATRHNGKSLNRSRCIDIYTDFMQGMKRVNTLNVSRNWNDLFIGTDAEEEYKPYQIPIPTSKWALLKNDWFAIGEKLHLELFERSTMENGFVNQSRVNQILEDAEEFLSTVERRKDIKWFLYQTWEI